ncbi:hypothetical protein GIB67_008737 [Kingdonia uniflora]|uniref:ABC transporter family G domain-containing protein n=1 Tax=Kingdonia uniflora TaxID=39325 RepID=A0A7J7P5Y3_9MAGN|nr:hypothetical protein GIB67_008737 [Kingdonia uniflora]
MEKDASASGVVMDDRIKLDAGSIICSCKEEGTLGVIRLSPRKKTINKSLRDVNGIVRPSMMTLLLRPPGSGKTTLLKGLVGKLDRVGTRYEMLADLLRCKKGAGIKPDPEIDAFMKATALASQETSFVADYILKILGLNICVDIMVTDDMRRDIFGEMLVGLAKALFMDEISTGLDSSTTFQIVKFMKQMVHIMDVTMIISLLQPPPEMFDLFDDVILLSKGQVVYQGQRENALEFFEIMGFKCPNRKGVVDFLQEFWIPKFKISFGFETYEALKEGELDLLFFYDVELDGMVAGPPELVFHQSYPCKDITIIVFTNNYLTWIRQKDNGNMRILT